MLIKHAILKFVAHCKLDVQTRCVKSAAAQKRKSVSDEVDELKSKKRNIETHKESLLNAADDDAEEAEHRHKTLRANSNAMRKAAKEKDVELKEVKQQLNEEVLKLTVCIVFTR